MLGIHSTNRIKVDQTTKEFSLQMTRVGTDAYYLPKDLRLDAYKRTCDKSKEIAFTMKPYAVKNGYAFFTVDGDIRTACVPAGMYDVKLMNCDCEIDSFELLKAPTPYINDIHVHDNKCADDKCGGDDWEEPEHCVKPVKKPKKEINCDCPNIENEVITGSVNLGEKI